jgi:hypothetical protein
MLETPRRCNSCEVRSTSYNRSHMISDALKLDLRSLSTNLKTLLQRLSPGTQISTISCAEQLAQLQPDLDQFNQAK